MADTVFGTGGQVRPTRHRLLATMAVSACFVAALLALIGSFVDLVFEVAASDQYSGNRLTVMVRDNEDEPKAAVTEDEQVLPSAVKQESPARDDASWQKHAVTEARAEPPVDSRPVRDWHAMAEDVARSSVAGLFEDRETRMAQWRQSHAIMFRPTGDFDVKEEEPLIPDFRFRPEIHVVGLGLTIGSCFIGIPLAEVPVEQRSVAITLFVCASDAG